MDKTPTVKPTKDYSMKKIQSHGISGAFVKNTNVDPLRKIDSVIFSEPVVTSRSLIKDGRTAHAVLNASSAKFFLRCLRGDDVVTCQRTFFSRVIETPLNLTRQFAIFEQTKQTSEGKESKKTRIISVVESEQVELRLIALFIYLKEQANQTIYSFEKQVKYLTHHAQYSSKTTAASNYVNGAITAYYDLYIITSALKRFIFTNAATCVFPR